MGRLTRAVGDTAGQRTWWRPAVALITVVTSASLVMGCGGNAATESTPRQGQQVRLAIVPGGAVALYPQVAAGQTAGLFKKNNVELSRIETSTSGDAAKLLIGGQADVATLTPDVAVQAIGKGAQLVIMSSSAEQSPWYLEAKNAMANPTEFAGKRLGVPQLTGTATFLARVGLQQAGVPDGKYEMIVTGAANQRLLALTRGAVDATVLPAPVNYKAEAQGLHRLLYLGDSLKAPGSVFVARREFVERNRAAAVAFLRATVQARDWLYDPAHKQEFLSKLPQYPEGKGFSPEDLAKTYDEFVTTRKIHPTVGTVDLTELVSKMVQFKELSGQVSVNGSIDNSLIQEAAAKQ